MANSAAVSRATPNSIAWILTADASGTSFVWTNAILQAAVSGQAPQFAKLLAAAYTTNAAAQAALEGIGATFPPSSLIYCDWSCRQLTGVAQVPVQLVSSESANLGIMTATLASAVATYLVTCWLRGITG